MRCTCMMAGMAYLSIDMLPHRLAIWSTCTHMCGMSAISISYQANAALQPLAAERGQAGQLHGLAALHLIALSRQHLAASVQWQQQYECFWLQQASSNDQPDLSAAAQLLRHGCLCQYLIVITVCSWTAG